VAGPTTLWGEQAVMENGAQDLSGQWPEGIDFNFGTLAWRRLFLIHLDYFCTLNNVELKIPSDVLPSFATFVRSTLCRFQL
jgi:hypothetical protein